ncbi:MAG TPA: carbamoyltransferase HypF [Dehalococcoidia bacterium]|nr:carbamoyltransferase HypF [Dehalococcoidia bacterium]
MDASLKTARLARLHIEVSGIVQGVGFRPFVYRLAQKFKLNGWVRNTSGNVTIEVEGPKESLKQFLISLKEEAPPAARIHDITTATLPPRGDTNFEIWQSQPEAGKYQPVSPDIATCAECLEEVFTPGNRRYLYPFTNCTNCGPRFTIIKDIPYDRPLTTMSRFTMCPECQAEYDDPYDRRFHAQPNACPRCGPSLELTDGAGTPIPCPDIIRKAAELLGQGGIIAVKGLGGFQLACDATNPEVVKRLRERKRRPGKPFALMMASLEEVKKHCLVSAEEAKLLLSPQAPIVLLRWRKDTSNVTPLVAERNKYLGVMLPYTPLHHILLRDAARPLVMTSGNLSEEPICRDNDEALRRLRGVADYFLLHNRDIHARYDDSVYLVERDTPRAIRRARGYAPQPIMLPFQAKQVLACGAEEKNTFCLTKDEYAFLSQHIGDMDNEETMSHFENTVKLYERLFRVQPEIIAHDLHPEYLPTKYALKYAAEQGIKIIGVQHHHAHIVSCLAENAAQGPIIGVAFDGTGYGTDGNLWGGEFLVCDCRDFQRAAHLEYAPMPGGAAAIRKPYRMALGYLHALLGKDTSLDGLPILGQIPDAEVSIISKQLERGLNSPLTSGTGRLFDAVSALAGVRGEIDYAAQAAIELEMVAPDDVAEVTPYPFAITEEKEPMVIKLGELIYAIVKDVKNGVPAPVISARFHQTMARIIVETSKLISKKTGLKTVALSGGVFQNRLLFNLAVDGLEREGFQVLSHRSVPPNDGGISLGQAIVANYREMRS